MKKSIIVLNEYLSNFWFAMLALIIGCLSVLQFSDLAYSVDYWETSKLSYLANIFGIFLIYFFLPLSIISIIISLFVWLKDKTGNSKKGLLVLLLAISTPCLIFFFIIRVSLIEHNININHSLSLPLPARINSK